MRLIRTFICSLALLGAAGCGKAAVTPADAAADNALAKAARDPQWKSDPQIRGKVTIGVPDGWHAVAADTMRNDKLKAVISMVVGGSHRSVAQEMVVLCERQLGMGFQCGAATLSADRREGSLRIKNAVASGEIIVVHFGPDGSRAAFFLGVWPNENEQVARAAFEHIVNCAAFDEY